MDRCYNIPFRTEYIPYAAYTQLKTNPNKTHFKNSLKKYIIDTILNMEINYQEKASQIVALCMCVAI